MTAARRVLIVDDDSSVRRIVSRVLARAGYTPLEAATGTAAYAIVEEELVDVVLLDVQMPDLPGTAVYHALVSRWPELRPAIALMTGDAERSEIVEWLAEHPCPVLQKPFDLRELCAVVAALADEPARKVQRA